MADKPLLVDPAVSRAKFAREVAAYRRFEAEHARRGWWMQQAEYPEVFVVFAAPQLKPPAVVFGALLDFTNYDFWAPSVRLVDPFTREPYKAKELPTLLRRRTIVEPPPEVVEMVRQRGGEPPQLVEEGQLMMWHSPERDDIPFMCLPGVREYHEHPAHTGNSWLLRRGRGEGTLYFLLEKLYKYGVQPLTHYGLQMQYSIYLAQQDVPE